MITCFRHIPMKIGKKKVSKYPSLVALPIFHCSLPIFLLVYLALAINWTANLMKKKPQGAACTPKSRWWFGAWNPPFEIFESDGKPRKESKRLGKNHILIGGLPWLKYHDEKRLILGFLGILHNSNYPTCFTQRFAERSPWPSNQASTPLSSQPHCWAVDFPQDVTTNVLGSWAETEENDQERQIIVSVVVVCFWLSYIYICSLLVSCVNVYSIYSIYRSAFRI